eukprot:7383656-Prymnesium_polylepis.1
MSARCSSRHVALPRLLIAPLPRPVRHLVRRSWRRRRERDGRRQAAAAAGGGPGRCVRVDRRHRQLPLLLLDRLRAIAARCAPLAAHAHAPAPTARPRPAAFQHPPF